MKKILILFLGILVFSACQADDEISFKNRPETVLLGGFEVTDVTGTKLEELNRDLGFLPDSTWKKYVNYDFGFSFYFPGEAVIAGQLESRFLETTVFQEPNVLYLTTKTYCDEMSENCSKVKENNIALLKGDSYLPYIDIYFGIAKNYDDLLSLVKKTAGEDCSISYAGDISEIDSFYFGPTDTDPPITCHTGKPRSFYNPKTGTAVFYILGNGGGRIFNVKASPDSMYENELYPYYFKFE